MEYFTRLRKFWSQDWYALLWLVLAIPVMISFHSIVHEGTHSLMAFFSAGSFAKIEPFLMEYDGGFQNGVTVGVYEKHTERTKCDPKVAPVKDHSRLAGWIGWPQVGALLIIIAFSLLFIFLKISDFVFGSLWRIWFVAALGDFIFNTFFILVGHCKDSQDWARVMIRGDHGATAFQLFTWLLWLIPLSHFVWVWWSKWGTEPLPERRFWGYRWVAFVLGVLSSISLIFYALVRDDKIGYTSAAYVIGLLMQISACVFYWIYFVVSFKHDEDQTTRTAT
jgi:hypothetical protein